MIKMVVPECKAESDADAERIENAFERRGLKRRTRPPLHLRGQENHQSGQYRAGWWEECEASGHNPYWTVTETIRQEDVVDEEGFVTGQRQKLVTKEFLNVIQVPMSPRHDAGQSVAGAIARGARFLPDMGYQNVCMMRNCENTSTLRWDFGEFCNERHARLVYADLRKVMLIVHAAGEEIAGQTMEDQLQELYLGPAKEL